MIILNITYIAILLMAIAIASTLFSQSLRSIDETYKSIRELHPYLIKQEVKDVKRINLTLTGAELFGMISFGIEGQREMDYILEQIGNKEDLIEKHALRNYAIKF